MGNFIDLTGQKFDRLTIIERVGNDKHGHVRWLCQCNCGKKSNVLSSNLRCGHIRSCGCLQKDLHIEMQYRHGHAMSNNRSKIYRTWVYMIQRCNNPNNQEYKHYGGRGIKVCEAWMKFECFLQDMGERPDGMSIDRINNNKGYAKENCKWSTPKEQARNTRRNKLITINGITKCLAEWCEIYQKPYARTNQRINRYKWMPEEALEIVPRCRKTKEK